LGVFRFFLRAFPFSDSVDLHFTSKDAFAKFEIRNSKESGDGKPVSVTVGSRKDFIEKRTLFFALFLPLTPTLGFVLLFSTFSPFPCPFSFYI
jgi:hypothetical protein